MKKIIICALIVCNAAVWAAEKKQMLAANVNQNDFIKPQGLIVPPYSRASAALKQKKQSIEHRVLMVRTAASDNEILPGMEYEHKAELSEAMAKFNEEGGDFAQKLKDLLVQCVNLYKFSWDLEGKYIGDVMWGRAPESSEEREAPILAVTQLRSDIRDTIFNNPRFKAFNPPVLNGKIKLSDNFTPEQQEAVLILLEASSSFGFSKFDETFSQCRPGELIQFLSKQTDQLSKDVYQLLYGLQRILNDYGANLSRNFSLLGLGFKPKPFNPLDCLKKK